MTLNQLNQLEEEGKYTITTAPTGSGKTWAIALLLLKKRALAPLTPEQFQEEKTNASQSRITDCQRNC